MKLHDLKLKQILFYFILTLQPVLELKKYLKEGR